MLAISRERVRNLLRQLSLAALLSLYLFVSSNRRDKPNTALLAPRMQRSSLSTPSVCKPLSHKGGILSAVVYAVCCPPSPPDGGEGLSTSCGPARSSAVGDPLRRPAGASAGRLSVATVDARRPSFIRTESRRRRPRAVPAASIPSHVNQGLSRSDDSVE